jgi:two-component system, chemotaxis family, protein-glutamate methylesterase/glutaminase
LLKVAGMANKDIIVIGASYGGIEAMKTLVRGLPEALPAAVFFVQHTSPDAPGVLPQILTKAGPLPASFPADSEPFQPGHIYVAPPDHHLLLERGLVRLTRGPKENRSRPAVDVLFRSAAYAYGPRVVGVVLTGLLDDGTAGLWAVKDRGGTCVVQDPLDAVAHSMPESALRNVEVDYCLPLAEIAPLLAQLAYTSAKEGAYPVSEYMKVEVGIAQEDTAIEKGLQELFEPSNYTCPECHGVLLQLKEGQSLRFRCHTGHAYSAATLLSEGKEAVEDTLWAAIRTLEERILLLRQLAEHLESHQQGDEAAALSQQAQATKEQSDLVRRIVMGG